MQPAPNWGPSSPRVRSPVYAAVEAVPHVAGPCRVRTQSPCKVPGASTRPSRHGSGGAEGAMYVPATGACAARVVDAYLATPFPAPDIFRCSIDVNEAASLPLPLWQFEASAALRLPTGASSCMSRSKRPSIQIGRRSSSHQKRNGSSESD